MVTMVAVGMFIASVIASASIIERIERSHRQEMIEYHDVYHSYMELQVENLELEAELQNCKAKLFYDVPVDIQEPLPYVVGK